MGKTKLLTLTAGLAAAAFCVGLVGTGASAAENHDIYVIPSVNGSVSAKPAATTAGSPVTLAVTPKDGYTCDTLSAYYIDLSQWSLSDWRKSIVKTIDGVSCDNPSFDMVDATVAVTVTFKKFTAYNITFDANYSGAQAPQVIKTDAKNKLVSTPTEPTRSDYTFAGWYTRKIGGKKVDISGSFTENATYYAHWTRNSYNINVVVEGNGTAQAAVKQSTSSENILLTATPGENAHFVGWEVVSGDTTIKTYGKYTWFEMPKSDVTIKAVFAEYQISEGINGIWTRGSETGLTIIGDGPFRKLVAVLVDGNTLGADNYAAVEGSTEVTLTPEFLSKLADGEHDFAIVWQDGTATTRFSIVEPAEPVTPAEPAAEVKTKVAPKTGANNYAAVLAIAALGLIAGGVIVSRKAQA